MIEWNDADPRERAWAIQQMLENRREMIALGYDAICTRCGQQRPKAWMVDGICTAQTGLPCEPPKPRRWWWWR